MCRPDVRGGSDSGPEESLILFPTSCRRNRTLRQWFVYGEFGEVYFPDNFLKMAGLPHPKHRGSLIVKETFEFSSLLFIIRGRGLLPRRAAPVVCTISRRGSAPEFGGEG